MKLREGTKVAVVELVGGAADGHVEQVPWPPKPIVTYLGEVYELDFVSPHLADRRHVRYVLVRNETP